jgi:protein gp37
VGERTGIEWTDATWNPVTGCTKVSAGCDNCYASTLAYRLLSSVYLKRMPAVDSETSRLDPFAVRLWPERLTEPHRWSLPRRVFVNSMSDLFHADIPDEFVLQTFRVMLEANHHTYQILTKRPGRALRFLRKNPALLIDGLLPRHVWIGTSVESESVLFRVKQLRSLPVRVRFLSCEPLLGALTVELTGIHWVIVGGESGPQHRPLELDWVRSLRDQCVAAEVPFFFKQIGGRTPKSGGRLLDGREWDEFPSCLASNS